MHRRSIRCIIAIAHARYFVKCGFRLMQRIVRRRPTQIVIAAIAFHAIGTAHAADSIGKATAIATTVTGTIDSTATAMKTGDAIFANQTLTSDASGIGQFELSDRTKLALGPASTIVLDDFIYNSRTSASKVVLSLTRGSFRFLTGKSNHDAYEIVTPAATIGVRGTAFDLVVAPSGEIAIAMISGAVEVCPANAVCRLHDIVGRFLHMTGDGIFSLHEKWDASFFGGAALKTALPFLDNQRLLAPALRGSTRIVATYLGGAVTSVEKVVKVLPAPKLTAPKLPAFKLRNPFR
jgi:hypothetical protein